jgi:hypothetical protein
MVGDSGHSEQLIHEQVMNMQNRPCKMKLADWVDSKKQKASVNFHWNEKNVTR